jgi:Cu(I)/Ag(I) efflux system membrane fusion protein
MPARRAAIPANLEGDAMPSTARPYRFLIPLLAGLVLGLALATAGFYAHVHGHLAPLYHRFGLHSLPSADGQSGSPTTHAGHAGHAGHGGGLRAQGGGEPSTVSDHAIVILTPERQQLIGVRTGKVEQDRLRMAIRAVGIIEPDQTRLARIHTRISGWVKKVHVNYVGQNVKKGDPLLEIYSPDLLSTQEEYLIALETMQTQARPELQPRLVDAARRRLELWGVSQEEIRDLQKTRKAKETLVLRSPIEGRVLDRNLLEGSYVEPAAELYRIADLSVVWLQAKVYEFELPHIELNQPVTISLLSQPGKELKSKVSFIEPTLQEMTRTVKVRVPIDNPRGDLMPGMYANLKIEHDMGHGTLIAESALLRTGERTLAFRVHPGGRFEPVEVTVGSRFGDRYEVLTGLYPGEEVVTSAGFLIDAESKLKATLAGATGHQHGSAAGQQPAPASPHQHGGDKKPDAGAHHHQGH